MGLNAKLFYNEGDVQNTLHSRISLSEEQISEAEAVTEKDKLLGYIKPELSRSLDLQVKHWIQGPYKNHTLSRPVRKNDEFDYVIL